MGLLLSIKTIAAHANQPTVFILNKVLLLHEVNIFAPVAHEA